MRMMLTGVMVGAVLMAGVAEAEAVQACSAASFNETSNSGSPSAILPDDGERVVFLGDSITHHGRYMRIITDYLLTRWPEKKFEFWSAGVGGDTSHGCLGRIAEDVDARHPTMITVMFGMNDVGLGNYGEGKPVEPQDRDIAAYDKNMRHLVEVLRKGNPRAKIVLMTPSPFDDTSKMKGGMSAFGANEKGLTALAEVVRIIGREMGLPVVDIHAPMTAFNKERQKTDPDFTLCGSDRVHPLLPGGCFMAIQFLKAHGVPSLVADIRIDAASGCDAGSQNAIVSDVVREADGVSFMVKEKALPFVVPSEAAEIAEEIGLGDFNMERLSVAGLAEGNYRLLCDGLQVGRFSAMELAAGVNLATNSCAPGYIQSQKVENLNGKRSDFEANRLRTMACMRWYLRKQKIDPDDMFAVKDYYEKTVAPKANKHYYEKNMEAYVTDWPKRAELLEEVGKMVQELDSLRCPKSHRWQVCRELNLLEPSSVFVEEDCITNCLCRVGRDWRDGDISVSIDLNGDVRVCSPSKGLSFLRLEWDCPFPQMSKVYRDAWERTGGVAGWYSLTNSPPLPWYTLVDNGNTTDGYGVAVQPNAFACWLVKPNGLTLILDLRAGSQLVYLGGRELVACRLVARLGSCGESAYAAARKFARVMCPVSRLPKEPVFGYNDWYCAYGKNTATNFLADAAYVTECAKGLSVQPYVVMDDGWQPMNPWVIKERTGGFGSGRGPWKGSSERFGMEMPEFAKAVVALGAKPGLWYRPLSAYDDTPDSLRMLSDGRFFDPTVQEVESIIRADLARFKSWGMKLVKIDYLVGDCMLAMEREMTTTPIVKDLVWRDRSRTSAEVVRGLYRVMREAAGDDMVIIGCNAFNHFAAGLFELQRTGDDTSGHSWNQTKSNGVNTLAMRAHQDGIFFSLDADCAGLASPGAVPWEKNRQWIDLLGRSGTATFISWFRNLATDEVRKAIAEAYGNASKAPETAEPLDWQETLYPRQWQMSNGEQYTYSW